MLLLKIVYSNSFLVLVRDDLVEYLSLIRESLFLSGVFLTVKGSL